MQNHVRSRILLRWNWFQVLVELLWIFTYLNIHSMAPLIRSSASSSPDGWTTTESTWPTSTASGEEKWKNIKHELTSFHWSMLGKFGKIHPLKSAGECRGYVMRSFLAKYVFLHVARIQIPMTDDVGWNAVGLEVSCFVQRDACQQRATE